MDKPGMNRDRPKCSKTVESDTNCAQRSVTHDPDTKVEPEICSNSPPTSCDHMKTFHANGEQPRCEISPACFSTTNLAKDIKADHNTKDLPRFPCTFPGCEKTYKNKRHISQHVKTDHAENPVRFPCTLCEKEFKTMSHLGRHSSTHTNEKPYKCTTCGRGFAQKSDLMHHELILQGNNLCGTEKFRRWPLLACI
ncbi:zinc finger protein 888 isoform X2 [Folsomia candida]|uniref:zinc finger protein 888 isoform X2 n=1 Tax=Folsomia candida TaxID=158441 RepID=UPI00160529CB|nr:zinc finger protein 888 isoform X2 [Folsomia candida]